MARNSRKFKQNQKLFFEKSNKICKFLISLIKEKRKKKMNIINKKGNISINSRDILKIIKEN